MRYLQTFCFLLFAYLIVSHDCVKLEERFRWRELEFDWPSEETKKEAIRNGSYKIENNLPLGIDIWRDKLFITVPRWKSGVAASLNYIKISDEQSPTLHPYPSWEANTIEINERKPVSAPETTVSTPFRNNASIVSTFRIYIDECDRLWVMDTGLADILGDANQISSPAILVFDLNTDQLLRRYDFPESDVKEESFFGVVLPDIKQGECDNVYAYVPDFGAYAMVVYDYKNDKSWRIKHNFFHFDPLMGNYNVGGVNFQWTDGVFGMAMGNPNRDGSRSVYFHALSSTKEFEVSNRVLQNESYSTSPESYHDYKVLGDRGENGQSTTEVFDDETEVMFYTQVNKDGVGCWNSKKPYNIDNQGLVDSDSDSLVFPNDVKIDGHDNLWVLSNRMPVFIFKSLNSKEYNYRILSGKISDLVLGTPCA